MDFSSRVEESGADNQTSGACGALYRKVDPLRISGVSSCLGELVRITGLNLDLKRPVKIFTHDRASLVWINRVSSA